MRRHFLTCLLTLLASGNPARAAEIGVTPVAVHLDRATDRATVSVTNGGAEPVIMQVEVVQWQREGKVDTDLPTADMLVNPSVFTVQPGQSQLVRVGLRRASAAEHEGTYRIVLREVPAAPRPGEVRVSGQVRVLMALRVPVYVAPANVVRELRWQATQASDGSIVASLRNEGNVHARVGKIQLRSVGGDALAPEHAAVAVVFPGESRSFRMPGAPVADLRAMTLEVTTDQGAHQVPVVLSQR